MATVTIELPEELTDEDFVLLLEPVGGGPGSYFPGRYFADWYFAPRYFSDTFIANDVVLTGNQPAATGTLTHGGVTPAPTPVPVVSVNVPCFTGRDRLVYLRPDGRRYTLHSPPYKAVLSEEGFGMPPLEYVVDRAPFQHGDTVRAVFLAPRAVQLVIIQNFDSRAAYWNGRADFIDALRPNRISDFGAPGKLLYYLANGQRRQLDVVLDSGPGFVPPEQGWRSWSFTEAVKFVAHDPAWYDPTPTTVLFGTTTGSVVFPTSFPITFTSFGGTASISYQGTWLERPTITITGPITGPRIENVTTGKLIELSATIAAGHTVTISLRNQVSVIDSDGTNLLNTVTPESDLTEFCLAPDPIAPNGSNYISVTGSGASVDTEIALSYYTRYIGI